MIGTYWWTYASLMSGAIIVGCGKMKQKQT